MSLLNKLTFRHNGGVASPHGPIGLDCALDSMHLVQFERTHDLGVKLVAKATLPYPQPLDKLLKNPSSLKKLIGETLADEGFSGHTAVSTLPIHQTSIVSLSYRLATGQNEARTVAELMQDRLNGPLKDWVIDFLPIRQKTAEDRLALVAYARREDAIAYLECWRKCGLEISALEIRPLAVKRVVYMMSGATLWNALSINFGRERSFLTLFSGRRVLYDQAIEFGEAQMLEQLVTALELPVDLLRQMVYSQDLVSGANILAPATVDFHEVLNDIFRPALVPLIEAVDRALVFAASETRGEPVREIFLLGSLARWTGIEGLMKTLLHLPVRTIPDPLASLQAGQPADATGNAEPEVAVAAGLALKNLLPNV